MGHVSKRIPRSHIVHYNKDFSLPNPMLGESSILLSARGVYYIDIVRLAINLCRLADGIINGGSVSLREMTDTELGTLDQYLL